MLRLTKTLIVAGMLGAGGGTAVAADLISYPVGTDKSLPIADTEPQQDWSGFYAGVYGVGQMAESGDQFGIGLDLGVNAQFDFVLLGGEVAVQGLTGDGGDAVYGQALGRAGLAVTDDVLLYTAAGYGLDLGSGDESDLLLGGGVEFALSGDVSLRAQYLHGFPIAGSDEKDQVTLGANVHF